MGINLHIYPSSFKNESRMLRETKSIIRQQLADQIYIAATWAEGLKEEENVTDKIKVFRLRSVFNRLSKGGLWDFARFFAFMFGIIFKFRGKHKPAIVNCHSLSILLVGVYYKTFYGARLIYDAHELETERQGVYGYRKKIAQRLEKLLIKKSDKMVVVGDKIAEWYVAHYPFLQDRITVIRNIPEAFEEVEVKNVSLKKEFAIPENTLLFIYQGGFFNGRGIVTILDAFAEHPDKHVVLMGFGPLQDTISRYVEKYPNIHIKDAVPPAELLSYTKTADVGISLIENVCLSYYYSLPNKVFEYARAEVPLIVSDFPEMSNYLHRYKIGWAVTPALNELKALLGSINKDALVQLKRNFGNANREVNWENEQKRLIEVYNFN